MKKVIVFSVLFITNFLFSQEFVLTNDNFKEKASPEKNYYVIEVSGKTQSELYKKTKIYITGKYKGVKNDGYNEVEPEQIVVDVYGSKEKTIIINFAGANIWTVSNRYEINFKDNKVMIKPVFIELQNTIESNTTASISSLFNKKGEPKKEKAIEFIQSETNEFILELIENLKTDKSNDW